MKGRPVFIKGIIDGETRMVDVSCAQKWGPVEEQVEWDDIGYFLYTICSTLYRLPHGPWVMEKNTSHNMVPEAPPVTELEFPSDQQAAEWLLMNGEEPPDDVAHFADHLIITPCAKTNEKDPDKGGVTLQPDHIPHVEDRNEHSLPEIIAGAFIYKTAKVNLSGYPLQVLREFLTRVLQISEPPRT